MEKLYRKNGNSNIRGRKYCRRHFIEKFGREPNIQDMASLGFCKMCKCISSNEWD